MNNGTERLAELSRETRKAIFAMIYKAGGGHIAPAFSAVEILMVLYFGGGLRYDPCKPDWEERDRFILSKGHACTALYAVLARAGFFPSEWLDSLCQKGSNLGGHPDMHLIPGVEATTGALGHGFSFAIGQAMAGKMDGKGYHTYVLLGDGECQEGSIWEAALSAVQHKLSNLTAIVDYNKFQAMDRLDNIVGLEPMAGKWKAFGWDVTEVDGHDLATLQSVLPRQATENGPPRMIIAHTTKGKGVSFMENQALWHYRLPNAEEMLVVLDELGFSPEEAANL